MSLVKHFAHTTISQFSEQYLNSEFQAFYTKGKRKLTQQEIKALEGNNNFCDDWSQIFVSELFEPSLIRNSHFVGMVVIGNLEKAVLKFHDLTVEIGIYNSKIITSVIGDFPSITDVKYLSNYVLEERVLLFNVAEINMSEHSKFGNGVLKDGEDESARVWLEIANENGGRSVLPFYSMLPADAFMWSRFRSDDDVQKKFVAMTDALFETSRGEFGRIGSGAVIKNSLILKDVKIGSCAYVKGALKLKNCTILSSEDEPSQVGEGVELVNGILGYGSKVFYQAVAVRFVVGRNCQIKYGARLLNSVLGDNSTISCCEVLNNLIFPFHEQHHNTSFLIATTIMGQSNIAAGATIGSNHNSRSPDGEIIAGRGFWAGLSTTFKHNSRFASFCLVAKGNYMHELNVTYPFSLVMVSTAAEEVTILPAFWFQHNMYALARNNYKFKQRDKRKKKEQIIETNYLAPDSVSEIVLAIKRIESLALEDGVFKKEGFSSVQDFLASKQSSPYSLNEPKAMKKHGATIAKAGYAWTEYRKMGLFYVITLWLKQGLKSLGALKKMSVQLSASKEWTNLGGQLIPKEKLNNLVSLIKKGDIKSWDGVHQFYAQTALEYDADCLAFSFFVVEEIMNKPFVDMTELEFKELFLLARDTALRLFAAAQGSREKDYNDFFRTITFESTEEMEAVIGSFNDNDFLHTLKEETDAMIAEIDEVIKQYE